MTWAELIIGNLFLASLIGALALVVGRSGRRAALAHALWVMFFAKLITPPIVSIPLPIPTLRSADPATADSALSTAPPVEASVRDQILAGNFTASSASTSSVSTSSVSTSSGVGDQVTARDSGTVKHASHPVDTVVRPSVAVTATPKAPSGLDWIGLGWLRSRAVRAVLFTIWFSGFGIIVVRGFVRLVRFRRLLAECGTDDEDATELVRGFLANPPGWMRWSWMRRRHSPRVVRVSFRVSPMLFGFSTRPIIVCPDQLWQTLSPQDRKAFLAHETAHFHRRDHWVRWLEWFVSAVYWWFPGVYFGQKQLERHEEACCDAWAVKMLETKPRQYAEALLRVVDFFSDHQIGLPTLASGMQPTASLEERLRLLMRNELDDAASRFHTWGSGLACAAIWMVHPDAYHLQWPQRVSDTQPAVLMESLLSPLPEIDSTPDVDTILEASLPDPPRGFWNAPPIRNWAGFSFDVSGYRLGAISDQGFVIERDSAGSLKFDDHSLTAIAEIPASGRVIIGDAEGNVRLWDLTAGMPVSLLGRHSTGVTSLAVNNEGSVFSADSAGSVIRWELQSGQTIARWTGDDVSRNNPLSSVAVQSIRCSNDSRWIAVLCGDWREMATAKRLHLLDSETLTERAQQSVDADTAIVLQDEQNRWCSVSWNGSVHDIASGQPIGTLAKHRVSALLLSQHAAFSLERTGQPSLELGLFK